MRVEGVKPTLEIRPINSIKREAENLFERENMRNMDEGFKNKSSEEEIIKSIETANKEFQIYDKRLEFSIHEKTKEIMVKVIDEKNDKVIREIPSEKILDIVANMMEMAGLLLDEKA